MVVWPWSHSFGIIGGALDMICVSEYRAILTPVWMRLGVWCAFGESIAGGILRNGSRAWY